MSNYSPVHCKHCNWTHFSVSKEYVKNWMHEWEKYCKEWPETKLEFYNIKNRKPPSVTEEYMKCFSCRGSYKDFLDGIGPRYTAGGTIQGILDRNENSDDLFQIKHDSPTA